jgi:hypothetical protein
VGGLTEEVNRAQPAAGQWTEKRNQSRETRKLAVPVGSELNERLGGGVGCRRFFKYLR